MIDIINELNKYVEDGFFELVNLRRYFHMYPEVSNNEFNTASKIEEELKLIGLNPIRVDNTGVYADIIINEEYKTLILRADIDALPIKEMNECSYKSKNEGVMHACGHDAHTASLLFATRFLVKNKSLLKGNVRVCFQMAEENGYGALSFLNNGIINASRSFGLHIASDLECGRIALVKGANNASVDYFKIEIIGKESHTASPQQGIDALYIASLIVTNIQGLVTRMTSPLDNVLIGIGTLNSGNSYNIIASNAIMEGSLRAINNDTRIATIKRIDELVKNISSSFGANSSITWKCYTKPLYNEDNATDFAINVATKLFGVNNIVANRLPSLSGDDFSVFIEKTGGCYAYIGSSNKNIPNTLLPHHNSCLDIDEDCLKMAVKMYSLYAIEYLK